jgi:hydrogenase maturation factor
MEEEFEEIIKSEDINKIKTIINKYKEKEVTRRIKKVIIDILIKWNNFLLQNETNIIIECYLNRGDILDTIYLLMEQINEKNITTMLFCLQLLVIRRLESEGNNNLINVLEENVNLKEEIKIKILITIPDKIVNIKNFHQEKEIKDFLPK